MKVILLFIAIIFISSSSGHHACSHSSETCINIMRCTFVMQLLMERPPMTVYDQLKRAICGFEGEMAKICCEKSILQPLQTTPAKIKPAKVDSHPNLWLLPEQCGRLRRQPRIFGGSEARPSEFPWMARLGYARSKVPEAPEYRCAGTIINDKYVLTAAHCVGNLRGDLKLVNVRVGDSEDCSDDLSCTTYKDFSYESIDVHPRYNSRTLRNDIALVRIKGSLQRYPAICLSPKSWGEAVRYGNLSLVLGWGIAEDDGSHTEKLRKVRIPVVPMERCARAYRGERFVELWDKQLCAGGVRGQDSCYGDSGGSLQAVALHKGSYKIVQFGIVSFGRRTCALKDSPAVYTSVAHYLDWILDTIRE